MRSVSHDSHMYLSSSEIAVRLFPVGEHLPERDSITPHITGVREGPVVDGLGGIPVKRGGGREERGGEEREEGRERGST